MAPKKRGRRVVDPFRTPTRLPSGGLQERKARCKKKTPEWRGNKNNAAAAAAKWGMGTTTTTPSPTTLTTTLERSDTEEISSPDVLKVWDVVDLTDEAADEPTIDEKPAARSNQGDTGESLTGARHNSTIDIDQAVQNDPQCAASYVDDMYKHFRTRESDTSARRGYMETQRHVNQTKRSFLVYWLIDAHLSFNFVPETLFLTVNLIDRYLERAQVSRGKLQLVGISCFFVAAKYEEIERPELRDLVYMSDHGYTGQDVS